MFEHRFKMIEVIGQCIETEIRWDTSTTPGLGFRFEGTHQQLTGVFLGIKAGRWLAQYRQFTGQIIDRFGHDIKVLSRV